MTPEENEKLPRTIKIVTLITIFMGLITLAGVFRLTTWITQSPEVLVINNDPVPVKPTEIGTGGEIALNVDYCKKQNIIGRTKVYLIGETGGNKPEIAFNSTENTKVGCAKIPEVPIPIPGNLPSDTYHVIFEVTYNINPVKGDKTIVFRSRSFKVSNPKLNQGDAQALP